MIDLFSKTEASHQTKEFDHRIKGLKVVNNLITDYEHDRLMICIDQGVWSTELKRRVQHYGYKYNYRARSITKDMATMPIPDWAMEIAKRLTDLKYFDTLPDQLIINEYLPGQGITSHIDCEPCFLGTVASVSLGSTAIMQFTRNNTSEKLDIPLFINSVVILQEDARYKWKHGIPARRSDVIDGKRITRDRRVSLTFRKVFIE